MLLTVICGRSGESACLLSAFHQCGAGLIPDSVSTNAWVEFVVGSRLAPMVFTPGSPVFFIDHTPFLSRLETILCAVHQTQ